MAKKFFIIFGILFFAATAFAGEWKMRYNSFTRKQDWIRGDDPVFTSITADTLTDGTLTITGGNLSTTGTGTFGDLVVDTNTLVVNAAGYTDRVGIGTATPATLLDVAGDASVLTKFNSGYLAFDKLYSFNNQVDNSKDYDIHTQVGTLAEVTASPSTWGGTRSTEFSNIWTINGASISPQNSAAPSKYPSILLQFQTGEVPTDALSIKVTGVANQNRYFYGYYIWDFDSNAWELLGSIHSTPYNVMTSYSTTINTNAENYIDTDGKVYILARTTTVFGGTLQLRLDYVDVEIEVKEGNITYENRNFNKPVSVTTDSTSAYSVFASDGTEVLKVDTMAKAFGGASLSVDDDVVVGDTTWIKGTTSISPTTAPTDDILTIQKTYTEDLGDGLNEKIIWQPTDASTGGYSGMEFRVNALGSANWSADSTLYGIRGKFFQETFGAVGNANTTLVTSYFTGASELNFAGGTGGDGVLAKETYAQILKPLELLAYSGTDMGDAYGLLIQASTANYANYAIDKETLLEIEKPTLADVNYQMVLQGNGTGTGIWFDSAERLYSDDTNLTSAAPILALDKIKFTQTDGNEYIDSLATGYMDYGATTAHRFNNQIDLATDKKLQLRDSAIGIYSQADTFMDLFADGGVRIGNSSAGAPTTYMTIEPDADTFWVGAGSGLPYGDLYVHGNSTGQTISTATLTQVTTFDTAGESNLTTPSVANSDITIIKTGRYFITLSSAFSGDANVTWLGGVYKNNGATQLSNLQTARKLGAGGDVGSVSISGIASLTADDTVEVWFQHAEGVDKSITVQELTLSIVMVGG